MNKQGCLLAVLEVIIAAMAIATVARQEVRELLKVTEEALTPSEHCGEHRACRGGD